MKQVPDRKRLRREYLRKKGGGYISMIISMLVILITGLMFLMFTFYILWLVLFIRGGRTPFHVLLGVLSVCMASGIGFAIWHLVRDLRETRQKVALMEYVPPIKAGALPIDEILVRGSEEPPVAQSEMLLRAPQAQVTSKEELLRVYHGEQL